MDREKGIALLRQIENAMEAAAKMRLTTTIYLLRIAVLDISNELYGPLKR